MTMHAEICPLCQGNGHLDERECHGCGGLGWVAVPNGDGAKHQDCALSMWWWQPLEVEKEDRPH